MHNPEKENQNGTMLRQTCERHHLTVVNTHYHNAPTYYAQPHTDQDGNITTATTRIDVWLKYSTATLEPEFGHIDGKDGGRT